MQFTSSLTHGRETPTVSSREVAGLIARRVRALESDVGGVVRLAGGVGVEGCPT